VFQRKNIPVFLIQKDWVLNLKYVEVLKILGRC